MTESDVLLRADIGNLRTLLSELRSAVEGARGVVFVGIYPALSLVFRRSSRYREVLRSARTYPDGMGVVWATRALGGSVPSRLATTDVVWDVLRLAAHRRWSVALYGATPQVVRAAADVMVQSVPGLKIVAATDGYKELQTVDLRRQAPDLMLVGRGAPLQEIWAHDTASPLGIVTMTCGGLFDFVAGATPRAPEWMQRIGLEWLFRVRMEPGRLLLRYALGNTLFLYLLLRRRMAKA